MRKGEKLFVQISFRSFVVESRSRIMLQMIDLSHQVLLDRAKLENEFHQMISATVSHEMRNPLNSILNQTDKLKIVIEKIQNMKNYFHAVLGNDPKTDLVMNELEVVLKDLE